MSLLICNCARVKNLSSWIRGRNSLRFSDTSSLNSQQCSKKKHDCLNSGLINPPLLTAKMPELLVEYFKYIFLLHFTLYLWAMPKENGSHNRVKIGSLMNIKKKSDSLSNRLRNLVNKWNVHILKLIEWLFHSQSQHWQ